MVLLQNLLKFVVKLYIQYTNWLEITNNQGTGDSSGNVLLITFEGVRPNDITIYVIRLIIGDITEKNYIADITTATMVKQALEGHCIYDGGYCKLDLSYSRHTHLNISVRKCKLQYKPQVSALLEWHGKKQVTMLLPI
uniref:Uncharacterized protein n=1 Tax=Leersia perrieri TaxID=77586 RepID=A0A0D9XQX3_9ORYZ